MGRERSERCRGGGPGGFTPLGEGATFRPLRNQVTRILLVEDDEPNRDMLFRRLTRSGHDVVVAADGEEALTHARGASPAIILMDMSLPKIDGWEAIRILKADEATRRIPIVALTAHAMEGDRERVLATGCEAYETKPVDFASLLRTIAQLTE